MPPENTMNAQERAPLSTTAMVLAAGMGMRMRPLTLQKPKPLLTINGRTMLDLAIDHLVAFGIQRVVVNCFYLGEQIEAHMATRRDVEIITLHETELLDTGGGVRNALPHFGGLPFFSLNADLPWIEGPAPTLARLADFWDPAHMDAALLMMPTVKACGFGAKGDFNLAPDGRLSRHDSTPPYSHVWISAQILKPENYDPITDRVFSNNRVWDIAEQHGRLYGLEHDGTCYHVDTPEKWEDANARLMDGRGWTL
ncbi:MAG: nucleotidyltransferase family protein [Alphaproteobacteria bacterium]|nr:nucleotidyltransferase family protein [Alphaproteobacteria bacterium]MBV8548734.1 nucleotidyltransferase family protein [Alphaproteobacteria bacterium]